MSKSTLNTCGSLSLSLLVACAALVSGCNDSSLGDTKPDGGNPSANSASYSPRRPVSVSRT